MMYDESYRMIVILSSDEWFYFWIKWNCQTNDRKELKG
ncbi:hypothetical protein PMI08_01738 [Brevibacillus sp. CF112]|nr:hypothetical protein PMI08_01738 [Brevibacillus sp. CF112]